MTHPLSGIGGFGKLQIKNVEEHALAGILLACLLDYNIEFSQLRQITTAV